ncbi:fatty acid synthase-like isoform X2 [Lycorma delicatula]|uniref:fatty acid synthase-like isoform X2 n=1 Tax=Lycorma delicatula TaxID=130591 RepID=UPI003F514D73
MVGDPLEVKAIENVFCKNRKKPLQIGSIKSNIGHTEPASAICSIVKVLISMETGVIPPNINFYKPRSDIEALHNGKIKVVSESTPWNGTMVGINSFGFGGANGHALLRWNDKKKEVERDESLDDKLPSVVVVSGRTEEAVYMMLSSVEKYEYDEEYIKLLYEVHKHDIPGHYYRGYLFHDFFSGNTTKHVKHFEGRTKEVWFVFSGLEIEEFTTFADQMMRLPSFAVTIQKCHNILHFYGINLFNLMSDRRREVIENSILKQLCITSIQIGLIELLSSVGVFPHKLLSFSTSELVCAYADGALTLEQTLMATYYYSAYMAYTSAEQKPFKTCDSLDEYYSSCTGNGIPVHHTWMNKSLGADELLQYLKKIIPKPKQFSDKYMNFISQTSSWADDMVDKTCSAEYLIKSMIETKSIKKPPNFITEDSIVIDFSLGCNEEYMEKLESFFSLFSLIYGCPDTSDIISRFFKFLGRLYEEGLNLMYDRLYPEVILPVSRGTPMIAPHIIWDHSKDWFISLYSIVNNVRSSDKTFKISLRDDELEYLSGHVIDGRNLFPAIGYLELVWKLLEYLFGVIYTEISVVFKNVKFHRATNISKEAAIDFHVTIQQGSGYFQVVEGEAVVVTGNVSVPEDIRLEMADPSILLVPEVNHGNLDMKKKDIYKELRLRGYNYEGLFKSLVSLNSTGNTGRIAWHNNWVAFIDNMLQMQILQKDSRLLIIPTYIDKLVINAPLHLKKISSISGCSKEVPVYVYNDQQLVKSGGIEIKGLAGKSISRKKNVSEPVLEKYEFIPYLQKQEMELSVVVRICIHLVLENCLTLKPTIFEIFASTNIMIAPLLVEILSDIPLLQGQITVVADEEDVPAGDGYVVEKKHLPNNSASLVIISISGKNTEENVVNAASFISEGGFIMCREGNKENNSKSKFDVKRFDSVKLTLVFQAYCAGERITLLKKLSKEEIAPVVVKFSNDNLNWLQELKITMKNNKIKKKKVLIVSENNPESGLIGFMNCLRKEPDWDIARGVLIQDVSAPEFCLNDPFYWNQLRKDLAMNVLQNGEWGSYRHLPITDKEIHSEYGCVNILNPGDLSTLTWLQSPVRHSLKNDDTLVYTYYCALNFRDVMITTGRLSNPILDDTYTLHTDIGFEYSGRLGDGQRVMGMVSENSFSTKIIADKNLIWNVPDTWSLEDAATVPVVYTTVIYALYSNGRLSKGDSVLIHSGSGGVGIAAITLALYSGCTVFTTVSTDEKRTFLKSHFPQLTDRNIGNSRDTSFEQMVMKETQGRGVDLVLNSLAEEKLQASVRCLANGGRFLEIGKYDLQSNNPLGMENFKNITSFHGIMLDVIFHASDEEKSEINKILSDVLKSGAVKPLRRQVFDGDQFEQAFRSVCFCYYTRYISTGKHIGKILIKVREEESSKVYKPSFLERPVKAQFYCESNRTYIVVGGLGGFGLELVDWLIHRGARNLVITSRTGIRSGYQAMRMRVWKKHNVRIEISTLPLTSHSEVEKLLIKASRLGPVAGIFNLAVELKDALFENMEATDFVTSLKPKAHVTRLLDEVSREMCPHLEQFVVFSSVSCGRGNEGQTNYGMANSIMERICERRRKQNYHGLAIQWGAVGDVGLVAEIREGNNEIVIGGTLQQKIQDCLNVLNTFLLSPHAVVSSIVVAEKSTGFSRSGTILDVIFNILGIRDRKTVSVHSTLAELGMDSMMAVEIKQILEQQFEIFLTSRDIRVLTISKLQDLSKNFDKTVNHQRISGGDRKETVNDNLQYLLMRLIGDEKSADDIIVKMPSLCPRSSVLLGNKNSIILLPGIEGAASVMQPLAKNLYWQVFCVQYPYKNFYNCSVSAIAQSLIPEIKKYIQPEDKFVIAGYSFGTIVAMEVTYLLEKEGYRGHLVLLDGSPTYVRSLITEVFLNNNISEDNMQRNVLARGVKIIWSSESKEFSDKLNEVTEWSDRLSLFNDHTNVNQYSKSYQVHVLNSVYSRLKAAVSYTGPPEKSILSSVALIRPTENVKTHVKEDYDLSKFCVQEVSIHVLEGNHITLLENERIGNILSDITGIRQSSTEIFVY